MTGDRTSGPRRLCAICLVLTLLAGVACRNDSPSDAGADGGVPRGGWFRDVGAERGVQASHESGARGDRLTPEIMGAGAALFDHDQDGDLDIYLTNGHRGLPDRLRAGGSPNRLLSQQADGRFIDRTEASGLGDEGYGMGVAVADFDNDGDLDLYLANYGPDRLYRNRGDGSFDDVSEAAGVHVDGWSTSVAVADFDADGWLDLVIARYVRFDAARRCSDPAGRPEFCGPEVFTPEPDVVLRNRGDGRFEDVSERAGVAGRAAAGLGIVCDDFDDDGRIDIYVANDAYENHLWINGGDWSFDERALTSGAAYNLHGQPEAGMGVVAADLDGDRAVDLFVTHLSEESNTFYRNLGADRGFGDATGGAGLAAASMAYTGFGVTALDVELDGDLDLFVGHGRVTRATAHERSAVAEPWSEYAEPNMFFLNAGDGRFTPLPDNACCGDAHVTRGLVSGDIDGDGDEDLLLATVQGPARLLLNEAPRAGAWLSLRAIDPELQRDAVGARIDVHTAERSLRRTIAAGSSYLSCGPLSAHVGLGDVAEYDSVDVRWPDGRLERFPGGPANRRIELVRGRGVAP